MNKNPTVPRAGGEGGGPPGPVQVSFLLRIAATLRFPGARARLARKCPPPGCV
ncbi:MULTISPECIES: hypothetical protein [unclassified Streptomyces]|uniref:hypothetical protein n=1 Tax=unclassified Streptomyces TaxID=2593676 RepID=UPI000A8CE58F|nr:MULTISPECIES: hypothetical protein [unclassified Streptomyces]QZZ31459.1 hypothetical protein A7X85_39275 [Streptomyces sp. ST1015]